jgi:hypothetical protein
MTIGVRYDVGFVKFLSDADSKNRVLSFMGTFEWPFRKKERRGPPTSVADPS